MRISARAIIIEDGKVLTMFRRKIKDGNVKEYYVIPGGGQDAGETLEDCVRRELKEELNVDIEVLGKLGFYEIDESHSEFFHCRIVSGMPMLGGEELERMTESNYYEPRYVDIDKLSETDLFGKEFVKKAFNQDYLR